MTPHFVVSCSPLPQVPNLIGYFRVITAIIALYYAFTDWQLSALFYFVSYFSDAFDGLAARALGQSTTTTIAFHLLHSI